jgi:hypothetical protein
MKLRQHLEKNKVYYAILFTFILTTILIAVPMYYYNKIKLTHAEKQLMEMSIKLQELQ